MFKNFFYSGYVSECNEWTIINVNDVIWKYEFQFWFLLLEHDKSIPIERKSISKSDNSTTHTAEWLTTTYSNGKKTKELVFSPNKNSIWRSHEKGRLIAIAVKNAIP